MIGPVIAVPAPPDLLQSLSSVEVTKHDTGRSGFEIVFTVGRSGPQDLVDYSLALNPLLRPCNRVVLMVTFNIVPEVLMDGLITNIQVTPGSDPGSSTMTVTGEDLTVALDTEERMQEHPAMDETAITNRILLGYPQYGLIPNVIPPTFIDPPIPVERTPVQHCTDLAYLNNMAQRHGHVFYVEPGPVPNVSTAYWGPPPRLGMPQKALSVNMGPNSNVDNINFRNDARSATRVSGSVQDRTTNQVMPVQSAISTRIPLSSQPAILTQSCVRQRRFRGSGLNTMQAFGRAQGTTDASTDNVITATGELDALRYNCILKPRRPVDVRGVGYSNDGTYYVKTVTHKIQAGEYKQNFTLTRDGTGALLPVVSNPVCV